MNVSAHNGQWARATASDARWAAVVARDPKADGTFYYSVETTGVYCRPSCAARLARPEHVRFHATYERSRASGLSAVQALSTEPGLAGGTACHENRGRLPAHRKVGGDAQSRTIGTPCGIQPLVLPPGVQGGHGADAASVRGGAARQARAEPTRHESYGDRSSVQRWIQLERTILRYIRCDIGYDTFPVSHRRREHGNPIRHWRMLPRVHPRGHKRPGHCAPCSWATLPTHLHAICKTNSPAPL